MCIAKQSKKELLLLVHNKNEKENVYLIVFERFQWQCISNKGISVRQRGHTNH